MSFFTSLTSPGFLFLFLVSLVLYYTVFRRWQWAALTLFGLAFFCATSPVYTLSYLAASAVVTTVSARLAEGFKKAGSQENARLCVAVGVAFNLGILALLKYNAFVIDNMNAVAGFLHLPHDLSPLGWAAPLGISFYTLQTVSYLLDSYWGVVPVQKSFWKTALFVGYFPQLTSGPVARYADLKDQLYARHEFNSQAVCFGLYRILWGLFKKLVIASRFGVIVDTIYANPQQYNGFYIWVAAAFFMIQLYADFSGCMDIIIGMSECYGIRLPENFRQPFFSRSVQEFWQRWHITLGAWMRDYVMYPLMRCEWVLNLGQTLKSRYGKRAGKELPAYLCMLVVWLLMGLWHGGGWKYVLGQGLWFWGCIVAARALAPYAKRFYAFAGIKTECFSWHVLQCLSVFALVSVGNIFFRAESFKAAFRFIRCGFKNFNPEILIDGSLMKLGLSAADVKLALLAVGVTVAVSALQVHYGSLRSLLQAQNRWLRWTLLIGLILSVIIFGRYGYGFDAQSFIYQVF